MNAGETIISIEQVSKRYPGAQALAEVSLQITTGELHAIVGENGAGKSTLMKVLAGIVTQYDGRLVLRGQPVHFAHTRDAQWHGISIIHQELNLVDELSAAANIFLGREVRTRLGLLDEAAMQRAATGLLARLECHVDARQKVGRLRVGDQQLVEIAKALSLEAEILVMDEPTSALTETEVARLFRVMDQLRGRGVTILYISHKMDEVFRLADRITVLRDGRLVATLRRDQTNPREVTSLMVGRAAEASLVRSTVELGPVVLETRGLSLPWVGHPREWRLRDISFQLHRGEILGLAGLMGAGRTELLESLFGASPQPPRGRVYLNEREVQFGHPREAIAAGVAMVSEDRKRLGLFDHLTVGQNITLAKLGAAVRGGLLSRRREQRLADEAIRRLGIRTTGPSAPITTLSGGNQQKAIIARWLLTGPQVLLLDDPTRGVDVGAKAELYRLIDDLCTGGLSIVITSSELPELLALCDRILVLAEGRLRAEFSRAEATEQRIMEAATLGIDL